jgi:citrate synthase
MTEERRFTLSEKGTILCELPVFRGTAGADVIDIKNLYEKTGMFAYDAGFNSTASCTSKITFVDDHAGNLFYRGYSINDLVEHCSFLEVNCLLLHGQLPSPEEIMRLRKKSKHKL